MPHIVIKNILHYYLEDVDLKDFEGITIMQIPDIFEKLNIRLSYHFKNIIEQLMLNGKEYIPFNPEELKQQIGGMCTDYFDHTTLSQIARQLDENTWTIDISR